MQQEIELKLRLQPSSLINTLAFLSPFSPYFQGEETLINTYYDSVDYAFSRQKSVVRIRQKDHSFTLTAKLSGKVTAGLYDHPEYHLPLPNDKPDLFALAQTFNLTLPCDTKDLQPIFQTNFHRKIWCIPFLESKIEVVFDNGQILSQGKEEKICELEIELKKGQVEDILSFVRQYLKEDGATLSATSKAHRGYILAGVKQSSIDCTKHWQTLLHAPISDKLFSLLQFEQHLIEQVFTQQEHHPSHLILWKAFLQLYQLYNVPDIFSLFNEAVQKLPSQIRENFDPHMARQLQHAHLTGLHTLQHMRENHLQDIANWLYSTTQRNSLLTKTLLVLHQSK